MKPNNMKEIVRAWNIKSSGGHENLFTKLIMWVVWMFLVLFFFRMYSQLYYNCTKQKTVWVRSVRSFEMAKNHKTTRGLTVFVGKLLICSSITHACKGLSRLSPAHQWFQNNVHWDWRNLSKNNPISARLSSSNLHVSNLWLQLSAKPFDSNMCRTKTWCIWFFESSYHRNRATWFCSSDLSLTSFQSSKHVQPTLRWGMKIQPAQEKVKWTNWKDRPWEVPKMLCMIMM